MQLQWLTMKLVTTTRTPFDRSHKFFRLDSGARLPYSGITSKTSAVAGLLKLILCNSALPRCCKSSDLVDLHHKLDLCRPAVSRAACGHNRAKEIPMKSVRNFAYA